MDADLESSVHCKTARWLSFFIRYTKNTLKYVWNDIGQYVKRLPSVLWLSWLDFIKSNQIIQQSQMFFYKDIWWVFPFCALTLLVERQEGHPVCKKLDIGLMVMTFWLEALHDL